MRIIPGFALATLLALAVAPARAADSPAFVGSPACAACHADQAQSWQASHHALAMRPATPATVLGDFNDVTFETFGVTTRFYRRGDTFMVNTDGPDGAPHDYEIAYTFGVDPLQQYLIALPGGRYQSFGIAWDSRPKDQGGQRWYALYPDQKLTPADRLHWTGHDQTWNYQCAKCHTTDLQKNFDVVANAYATTFAETGVGCETCHGPGAGHVAWAQAKAPDDAHKGLLTWLNAAQAGAWEMNPETGIARRTDGGDPAPIIDACAGCHARRSVIADPAPPGSHFLDAYLPALLEPGLYHADGQIDGEVFEYGSFVQSRMFGAGVTCINCHDPHAGGRRAGGNALCAQCHMPAKFDVPEHHHHAAGGVGAQCATCHMPAKTYMGVDLRRDHSFRVPRPDLTLSIGVPNTCNQCHTDKTAEWAAQTVAQWYPNGRQTTPHYGTALAAGRAGAVDAETRLAALVRDPDPPGIARASALPMLATSASATTDAAIGVAAADPDALLRLAAPRALSASPSPALVSTLVPALADPVRAVRIEAARAIAGVDPAMLTPEQHRTLAAAVQELRAAEAVDADRPEAHLNLGLLDIRLRLPDDAAAEYRTALRLDPAFVPAMLNLADLDRTRGMDREGAELLRQALAIAPGDADVHHALGLLLVRQHALQPALDELRQASALAPGNARYAYVYAVALNSAGNPAQAMEVLERAHRLRPADTDVTTALISIARARGDSAAALRYARELAAQYPADPQVHALIRQLEAAPPR